MHSAQGCPPRGQPAAQRARGITSGTRTLVSFFINLEHQVISFIDYDSPKNSDILINQQHLHQQGELHWPSLAVQEMATHSSILTWKIPWMEEPGRLQSMGLQRVRHD